MYVNGMVLLAAGIAARAIVDHRDAVEALGVNPDNQAAMEMKADVERFVESRWFGTLCEVNPGIRKACLREVGR